MRPLNPSEQFLYNRSHDFAVACPDPFRYTERLAGFLHELACATATLLGESASPMALVDFTNVFYAKLAEIHHGVKQDVRLSPHVTVPERMPAPEDIPTYVENLALPPAPPVERREYVRNTPRGAAVGPAYLPPYTIQAKREALKWTRSKLGEKAGLSDTFVSELERGIATGRLKHYEALRRALNLPITGQAQ